MIAFHEGVDLARAYFVKHNDGMLADTLRGWVKKNT